MERQDRALTITQHFGELRRRLLISVGAVAIATGVSFIFAKHLFRILIAPAGGIDLIYIEMTEMLGTYMKVALFSGMALALPVLLYQIIAFLKPALLSREKKHLYLVLCGATVCFIGGVLFGYFVLLPPAMHFLLSFGSDIAAPQIKIGAYISLVVRLLFFIGLSFETPLLIFFLARLNILSTQWLSRQRKWAILLAFVLGAIITPTFDPVNQTVVAAPIIVLYELGIGLARLAGWLQRHRAVQHDKPLAGLGEDGT